MSEQFYTVEDISTTLKVTPQAVYNWIKEGRIEAIKIGRAVRVPAASYERLLLESRVRPGEPLAEQASASEGA